MSVPTIDLNEFNFRNKFDAQLRSYEDENKGSQRKIWTKAKVEEVLNNIRNTKIAKTKGAKLKSMEYYWSGKYDSIVVNGQECITFKKKKPEDPTIRIIPREDFFDILKPVHLNCSHGGRDKMLKSIKNKFYIPKKAIELYSSLCPVCGPKRNNDLKSSKNMRPNSNLNDFNTKGIVDILDFQSHPDGEFKWLLKYQDHSTRFFNLRPLKSKEPKEIAMELLKIFLTFGPPSELQSHIGTECIDNILKELKAFWPDCKIIYVSKKLGCQQRIQSENSRDMVLSWMSKNNMSNWSVGCFFYQYHINSSFAYRALFCREPKDILSSTNVASTMLLSEGNVATKKNIQNQIPETITENCSTILETYNHKMLESNNTTSLNDEENTQPLNNQMEYHEMNAEIKIEFDDSEIYDQCDYDIEENSKNSNDSSELAYTKDTHHESEHLEHSGTYDDHDELGHNLEANSTDSHAVRDEPYVYFNDSSKVVKLKIEPMEEMDPLQNTCAVCKNDMLFVENTILCFNCNVNIHKTCGISAIYKDNDIKELCVKCASKRVPGFEEKVAFKGIKREAEETIDNMTTKRVLLSASGSDVPGQSSDR